MATGTIPRSRVMLEGVVIVFSILLAFGIDAWWDRRQAVELESTMVDAVVAELERNAEELDRMIERLDADLDRIDRFLRTSESQALALSADSVSEWVGALNGRASFNADLEATGMLLRSPVLDSKDGLELRGRLGSWRNEVEEAELLGTQLDEAQIRVERLLASYAVRTGSSGLAEVPEMVSRLGAPGLSDIRADEALVAAVIQKAEAQRIHRRFLVSARSSLGDLLGDAAGLRVR